MRVALPLLRTSKSLSFHITLALTFVAASNVLPPIAFTQNQSRPRRVTATTPTQAAPSASQSSTTKAPQEIDDEEVIKVITSEVLLPVTVRDAAGRLVSGLTRRDFRVWEDGREQALSDLALRRVPVDVVLMVDSSSSVAESLGDFQRAADEFATRLTPEDRFSLIKFDDRVELLQDWTRNRAQLRRALRRVSAGMFTRFNDALYLAAREQFGAGGQQQRRRAVVVLSDGIDSGRGQATLEATLRALLEAQVAVYAISNTRIERARKQGQLDVLLSGGEAGVRFNELRIGDLREGLRVLEVSERGLAQLAVATGGRLYTPESFAALEGVYAEVAEELRIPRNLCESSEQVGDDY